jgi:hypothetical protein
VALWAILGLAGGYALGTTGMLEGTVLPSRGASDSMRLGVQVTELMGQVEQLTRDLAARDQELGAERKAKAEATADAGRKLANARAEAEAAVLKSELLGSSLSHARAGGNDTSRRQFAGSLCKLIKQAPPARIAIISTPLQLPDEQIRAGLDAEAEALLLRAGVDAALLAKARQVASSVHLPSQVNVFNVLQVQRAAQERRRVEREALEAVASIQRLAKGMSIVQTVRFADGGEHRIPADVALWMHANTECRPG